MSYFVGGEPPKQRQGIGHGVKQVPVVPVFPHNDQVKEEKIAAMQAGAQEFIFKLDMKSSPRVQAKAIARDSNNTGRGNASHVFQEPRLDTPPKRRIRTGVTDDELRKIWAEDEKKDRAAKAMMDRTDLVTKMHKDSYPMPRQKDAKAPRKLPGHVDKPEENTAEPQGFKGMGDRCAKASRAGVMCKPQQDYIAPELRQKPHKQGRRTLFPPNTFSFQEDVQTFGQQQQEQHA